MESSGGLDVCVVTVTYNEKENIGRLIFEIENIFEKSRLRGHIVVVDDNSPDGTGQVVAELSRDLGNLKLVERPGRGGIGSAYRDGLRNAEGDIVVTMDADFSHPPSALPQMVCKAREGSIAIGSRFLKESEFATGRARRAAAMMTNSLAHFLLRTGVWEHTNGYLAMKRVDLDNIIRYGEQVGIDPFSQILYGTPILAIAKRLGISMIEVPAPYRYRTSGVTKIGVLLGVKTILGHMLYIWKLWCKLG